MKSLLVDVRNDIKNNNASSKLQAQKYELLQCWSYAYLARWVVLEKGLKSLYDFQNRESIRLGSLAWLQYLDGNVSRVPDKIKDFSIQTRNIPSLKFITDLLGSCNSIRIALDSNDKYRPKRNRIAHKAEEFRSEKDYLGYRIVIDKAITQLIAKLSQKINTRT